MMRMVLSLREVMTEGWIKFCDEKLNYLGEFLNIIRVVNEDTISESCSIPERYEKFIHDVCEYYIRRVFGKYVPFANISAAALKS